MCGSVYVGAWGESGLIHAVGVVKECQNNKVETKYSDQICQQDTMEDICSTSTLYPVFLLPAQLETGYSPVP